MKSSTLGAILDKFENNGQSESRAMAECIRDGVDALVDAEGEESDTLSHSLAMAQEFQTIANAMVCELYALNKAHKES